MPAQDATLQRIAQWAQQDTQRENRRRVQVAKGEAVRRQQEQALVRQQALANNRRAAGVVEQLLAGGRVVALDPPGIEIDANVGLDEIEPYYDECPICALFFPVAQVRCCACVDSAPR